MVVRWSEVVKEGLEENGRREGADEACWEGSAM